MFSRFFLYLCLGKISRQPMNLPIDFVQQIHTLLGQDEAIRLADAIQTDAPVSIRLNEKKCKEVLSSRMPLQGQVPWCPMGYYLDRRPAFTFDPLWHAGLYYVQEASSMFLQQALCRYADMSHPLCVLDLCASPGGKSTHLRSLLTDDSLLISNEIVRTRAQILAENMIRWGHPSVVVTNSAPDDFTPIEASFDLVLADVPCSGEGMFRKDEDSIKEWSTSNVDTCWRRQRTILEAVWPTLKPGGLLIYSTCTYNIHENEENIRWMRDEYAAEILPLDVPMDWHITGCLLPGEDFPIYRFLPHRTRGEGFFMAILRKPGESEVGFAPSAIRRKKEKPGKKPGKKPLESFNKAQLAEARSWLKDAPGYEVLTQDDVAFAFPSKWTGMLQLLQSHSLHILMAGTAIARLKGRDLMPCHSLAMSLLMSGGAFPRVDLDYAEAISYLRRESIVLRGDAPRGYVLATYRGCPLGFLKNVGNRANNLYPQEWRIKSGYMPGEDPSPL